MSPTWAMLRVSSWSSSREKVCRGWSGLGRMLSTGSKNKPRPKSRLGGVAVYPPGMGCRFIRLTFLSPHPTALRLSKKRPSGKKARLSPFSTYLQFLPNLPIAF